eukprot:gene4469-7850_t
MKKKKTNFKFVILGDPRVGKSCIRKRFCKDSFKEDYKKTKGIRMKLKKLTFNNIQMKLQIFDVPSNLQLQIYKNLLHDADGVIFVYDITSKETFKIEEGLLNEIRFIKENYGTKITIVGNKIDLEKKREVSTKEGEEFSTNEKFFFYEVSSKMNVYIDELFVNIVNERRKDYLDEEEQNEEINQLLLDNAIQKPTTYLCCCYFY